MPPDAASPSRIPVIASNPHHLRRWSPQHAPGLVRRIVRAAWRFAGRDLLAHVMERIDPKNNSFLQLVRGLRHAPAGKGRIVLALVYGAVCHTLFAAAVAAMIVAMFFGMNLGLGTVPAPWSIAVNALLILQFPIVHSFLLGMRGRRTLERLAPGGHGRTLATTSYAIIASAQLLLLFALWTPSGIVWWRAEGAVFGVICALYAASWLLLIKASHDAGAELQSGALGWMSLAQDIRPVFPDMPTGGLFRHIRQPIYAAFALTLWTVPVWTPDQLALATVFTAYCLAAPRLKERRFEKIHGERFADYKARVPYILPWLTRRRRDDRRAAQ